MTKRVCSMRTFMWKCPREGLPHRSGRMVWRCLSSPLGFFATFQILNWDFLPPFFIERITDESVWNGTLPVWASFPVICIMVECIFVLKEGILAWREGLLRRPSERRSSASCFQGNHWDAAHCRCVGSNGYHAAEEEVTRSCCWLTFWGTCAALLLWGLLHVGIDHHDKLRYMYGYFCDAWVWEHLNHLF